MTKKRLNKELWQQQTLEQLENEIWPPIYDATFLILTCHALRKKPLFEFDVEDLRLMIGQNVGWKYLIPLALEKLDENILAEGHFYPGDLFEAVLDSEIIYWMNDDEKVKRLKVIAENNIRILKNESPNLLKLYKEWLKQIS